MVTGASEQDDADVGIDVNEASEPAEPAQVELHALTTGDLVHHLRLVKEADDGAVLRGRIEDVIGGDETAAARHVLNDNNRSARNVPADVARHEASGGVKATARPRANNDGDGLATVEVFGRGNAIGPRAAAGGATG